MAVPKPFNFQQWLDENRDLLKPPVANKNLTPESDDYIVMVVAGPNARKDYHYNETEEFFYQLEGNITVIVQVDGEAHELHLGPGDMMTVPAKTPHSPIVMKAALGWWLSEFAKAEDSQTVCCGFATNAMANCTKPILN